MQLIAQDCYHLLNQLGRVIAQFSNADYGRLQPLLLQNSIGMHVRHVLEFYQCLIQGAAMNEIDYDARKRNLLLQSEVPEALNCIEEIGQWLEQCESDQMLKLVYHKNEDIKIDTSIQRELAYNKEHCIHHMAIIRICIQQNFPTIQLEESFGIAESTLNYRNVLGKLPS